MGNHINPSSKLFLPGQIAQAVLHLAVTVAHTLLGKKCVCLCARARVYRGLGLGVGLKDGEEEFRPKHTDSHTPRHLAASSVVFLP